LYQTEIFLGILGGLSVLLIHTGFILVQYFIQIQHGEFVNFFFFRTGFLLFCFLIIIGIGMLTGMEIPLFIRMATQKSADKDIYNRVIGVDCLGACVGGMLFPLLLLPFASLLSIGFLVAMTNLLCLLFILFAFRKKVVNFGIRLSICVVMIMLLHTNRVEKSYWKSPTLEVEKIRDQFILGLEQAKDTIMPEIQFCKKFRPFVEDELPGMIKEGKAFVAHCKGDEVFPTKGDSSAILLIGPEGGFIPFEIEMLKKNGCKIIKFGERIMNVETAVVACVSRFM